MEVQRHNMEKTILVFIEGKSSGDHHDQQVHSLNNPYDDGDEWIKFRYLDNL